MADTHTPSYQQGVKAITDLQGKVASFAQQLARLWSLVAPGEWHHTISNGPHTASSSGLETRLVGDWLELTGTITMKNETAPFLTVLFTLDPATRPSAGRLGWASDASTGSVNGIGIEPDGTVLWRGGEIPAGGVVLSFEGTRVRA